MTESATTPNEMSDTCACNEYAATGKCVHQTTATVEATAQELPWRVSDKHGLCIVDASSGVVADLADYHVATDLKETRANAEFIMLAVNSYSATKARIERLEAALSEIIGEELSGESNPFVKDDEAPNNFYVSYGMLRKARALITAAALAEE